MRAKAMRGRELLRELELRGWVFIRQSPNNHHRVLANGGARFSFAYGDNEQINPKMAARIFSQCESRLHQ